MDKEILELKKKLENYKTMWSLCCTAPAKHLLKKEIEDTEKKLFEFEVG